MVLECQTGRIEPSFRLTKRWLRMWRWILAGLAIAKKRATIRSQTTHHGPNKSMGPPVSMPASWRPMHNSKLHDHLWWTERKRNIYLSIYPSSLSIQPSSHPAIQPSIYPSIHLSIYPSIHLSIYLSICVQEVVAQIFASSRGGPWRCQAGCLRLPSPPPWRGTECDDCSASGGLWGEEFLVAAGRDVWNDTSAYLQSNEKLMPNSSVGQNLLVNHHGIAVSRNSWLSHA